jgi:hypothetical protein
MAAVPAQLVRRIRTSDHFIDKLADLCGDDDDEVDSVLADVKTLAIAAEKGQRYVLSGSTDAYFALVSGRFVVSYQFTAQEVHVTGIRLKAV